MIVELLAFVVLVLIGIKCYVKWTTGRDTSRTCMAGRTAIVTGSNIGIGFETAMEFAKRGARVILACRNVETANKARDKIIHETGNGNVVVKRLDFCSFKSVKSFAEDVLKTEKRIDILVNNAGGVGVGNKLTEDGLPIMMQSNHFGNFLLTLLLLDKIKQSAPSRIVNVASLAGNYVTFNLDHLTSYPSGLESVNDMNLYGETKLNNVLFTVELAERLKGSEVTVNCLHPGAVNTELFRHAPKIILIFARLFFKMFFKTPEEGAQTTLHLALSKEVEHVSGYYFSDCKKRSHFKNVNKRDAEELWRKTVEVLNERGFKIDSC